MKQAVPPNGRKRATNVSLRKSLLEEAKALGINISVACERGLEAQVRETRAQRWLKANRSAIQSSNAHVASNGLALGGQRRF